MSGVRVFSDLDVATMAQGSIGYGLVRSACIAVENGRFAWVGPSADLPREFRNIPAEPLCGRLVTPALIDCHTHIVHGGNRAQEFEMRLEGVSYEEIARAGGGIASTVKATRETDEHELLRQALGRADALIAQGVGTIEIKSGYGLDIETELKMLRVARAVGEVREIDVRTSFLGAHAVPTGMNADEYIDEVCIPALIEANKHGLVDAVDGFCEGIAFSAQQIERVFAVARSLNIPVKLHAEQLSHQGGTALAAKFGAMSVDHLEYATEEDAKAMAASGSVAVMLPGAYYTLRETQLPPIDAFRRLGVPMAVATDWNPGSSPLGSVLLAMNMACTLFRMTPAEVLAGTTANAARALRMKDRGQIAPGMKADFAVWDVSHPAELCYGIGINPLFTRYFSSSAWRSS